MKIRTEAVSMITLLAIIPLTTTPARAQTAQSRPVTSAQPTAANGAVTPVDNEAMGDIIVTATRVESNLQKTPVAITALSASMLEQRGVRTLLDVGNYTPSLSIGGRGGSGTNQGSVAIRGIGSDAPDSAPSVGIYIDDVYYPSVSGNLLGLFDVARIEVLRGPQGTLFGRNTIAGAIQYISVKPQADGFGGFAFASTGTLNSYELSGAVNVPLGDKLALRVSGQASQRGGYVRDALNGIDRGREYGEQGRVQLRWTPSDRLTVDLKGETAKVDGNGRPLTVNGFNPARAGAFLVATGVIPALPPFLQETRPFLPSYISASGSYTNAGFNQPDYFKLRYTAANAVIAYDVTDDIRFKSISAYSFTKSHIVTDFDATPLSILSSDRGTVKTRLFTQEAQLSGDSVGNRLHWTTGLYFYDSRERTSGQVAAPGLAVPPISPDTQINTRSYAAYGQATFDIVAGISVAAGLRYSREEVNAIYPAGLFPTAQRRFSDTSPYVGVNWQANDDMLFYAKASKGFRAGGYHLDRAFTGGSLFFGPETAWTYEAGARLTLFDRRLRLNPTVFWTDWNNIQFVYITLPAGTPIAATQNAGDARQKGIELEGQFAVTPKFQLTGSASYLDAHYRRLAPPTPGSVPITLTLNDPLARAPKFHYAVGGRYTIDGGDGSKTVASLDYSWTDKQRSSVDGDQAITLPSYGLLNARIEFTPVGDAFTFAIYGTNLTGKYYLIDGINFQSSAAVQTQTIGRPREFGASARIRF